MIEQHPLPYLQHGSRLAASLKSLPWAIWLDSGQPRSRAGRYDIFVAGPKMTIVSNEGLAVLTDHAGRVLARSRDEIGLIRDVLRDRRLAPTGLPFCGGMVGYFGYDLGRRWQGVRSRWPDRGTPDLAVGFYDWAVVTDHQTAQSYWVGRKASRSGLVQVRAALAAHVPETQLSAVGAVMEQPGSAGYAGRFDRLLSYIRDGDCYQVNLARRFSMSYGGDPWAAYLALRESSPSPFAAYLTLPFAQVLCVSPERFLLIEGREIQTRPIKGTRPRQADVVADRREAEALQSSAKDRAENVMIVDLLRNDLGKICELGSIRVSELCKLESFAHVHHLVSTIYGRLRPDADPLDALLACLPGGSITGAPKHRAMEIIDELEPARRGIYCGAIGYLSDDGRMDTNIAIRTAVFRDGELSYWAGGGIVADSSCPAEFEETQHKARAFVELARLAARE